MRVGIIGTRWGRVHIGSFRRCGWQVAVLVGRDGARAAEIAAAENIPVGTDDPDALEAVDAVVIASPASTHRDYLARFAHKKILCEKPMLLPPIAAADTAAVGDQVWVNYPFAFLEPARRTRALLTDLGPVARADLRVDVDLPGDRSAAGWFLEVAVHPLAFLSQLLGVFSIAEHRLDGDRLSAVLTNGAQLLFARLDRADAPGIRCDLALAGERGTLRLRGGYCPARGNWEFDPLLLGGEPRDDGTRSPPGADIWIEACAEAAATFTAWARGEIGPDEATARGLTSGAAALAVETELLPLFA